MYTLNLSLLGGFDARFDSSAPLVFSTKKAKALLAYLAFQAGRPCARGTLAGLLWPYSAEEQARATLRQTLSTLRKSLGGYDGLKSQADQIVLAPESLSLDVTAFEAAARAAEPSSWKRAAVLYRGELMAGLALRADGFENWLAIERERLRELALSVLVQLLAHHEESGDVQSAIDIAGRLLRIDATQEEAHRALMRLYMQQGRRGMALRQYELCLDALQRDLDVAPEADTTALYETVRAARQTRPVSSLPNEPFKGLATYEYEDAAIFHGRHRDIAATKQRLIQQASAGNAFLLIYGASGCGKSSLARAGLLPAVTQAGAVPGIETIRHTIMRPSQGRNPLAGLLSALVRCPGGKIDASADLLGQCRRSPESAIAPLRKLFGAEGSTRVVLLVDQLEELFSNDGLSADDRVQFVRLLAALAGSAFVWVVATMRSDFYSRCMEIPSLSELKDGFGSYELAPPTGAEMFQIIREPVRTAGVAFEKKAEDGRLDDLLQQEAMRAPSSLPLLQFVLQALYAAGAEQGKLTFADYHALGGLAGAVAHHADEVVAGLPADVRDALPGLLRALVTLHPGDMPTIRQVEGAFVEATPQRIALAEALVEARLLVTKDGDSAKANYRLVHEALLRRWPLARQLLDADRERLEIRTRVRAECRRWLAEDKNPELLLPPGKRLAEAAELLTVRRDELSADLTAFIEASRQAETQRREAEISVERERLKLAATAAEARAEAARRVVRLTRIAAAITFVFALAAVIGAVVGFRGQQDAQVQAGLARAAEGRAERQAIEARTARDAAVSGRNRALQQIRALIERGADLDKSDAFGTPLHHAAVNGHEIAVELLLAAGADPNAVARDGSVPLHWAAFKGHREVAERLINAGADVTVQGAVIGTPLHLAADQGQTSVAELLIAQGADPNSRTRYGRQETPLHKAALAGYSVVGKVLIGNGAEVNALDTSTATPLLKASLGDNIEIAALLISHGADPTLGYQGQLTPLHRAAEHNNSQMAELLIDAGANVNAISRVASLPLGTPLDWAITLGNQSVAKLLRQHDALREAQLD